LENVGIYILTAWCVFTLVVIVGRTRKKRETISPVFKIYLLTAIMTGLAMTYVGASTAATGHYPECGALIALLGILACPLALFSIFLAPARYSIAALAYLVFWTAFNLAGMFATANGCPPWVSAIEGLAGLALGAGSLIALIQTNNVSTRA
jgi:membrane associated rhomboid family serine protease